MKPLQILHTVATLLLLVAVLGLGVLVLTGVVEVRFAAKDSVGERSAVEQNARPTGKQLGAKARLLVVRGAKPRMEYPIFEGANVIGRADEKPVEIDLEFQEAQDRIWSSRQHAVIVCNNGSLVIEDLNSTNGTYVNRSRVRPGTKPALKANDIIQIGEAQLKVLR
jgi:hypothetical protein